MRILMIAAAMVALSMGTAAGAADAKSPKPATKPEVRSAMALVVDAHTGEAIFERNVTSVVPIASITKLMTALVILDGKQPLDEVVEITAADRWKGKGAHSRIPIGAKITRGDLM